MSAGGALLRRSAGDCGDRTPAHRWSAVGGRSGQRWAVDRLENHGGGSGEDGLPPPVPPALRVLPSPDGRVMEPTESSEHSEQAAPPFSAEDLLLLSLFAEGHCVEVIARRLDLSERTIRRRSRELCDRIGAHATIQVVAWAARRRLI